MSGNVGILVVGNEILDGLILDTNSRWLINRLKSLNLVVKEIITVRDEVEEISKGVHRLKEDGCDLIFTTGGLGPTHDDLTTKGVADSFEIPLELNEEALRIVKRQYAKFHEKGLVDSPDIIESRKKMAVIPMTAKPIDNRVGGAPGIILKVQDVSVISLPGVPREMEWMFDNELVPTLKQRVECAFSEQVIYLPLKDESALAPIIDEVMKDVPDVYIKSMVKPYGEQGIRIWVSAYGSSQSEVDERIKRVANLLVQRTEVGSPEI